MVMPSIPIIFPPDVTMESARAVVQPMAADSNSTGKIQNDFRILIPLLAVWDQKRGTPPKLLVHDRCQFLMLKRNDLSVPGTKCTANGCRSYPNSFSSKLLNVIAITLIY